ncbi:MAG: tetratricopeptide repeat protein [Thermodesulfobacteriota bacterium]
MNLADISAPSCNPDQTRCWRTHLWPLLLLFVLLTIIYANSFQGAWIFDDQPNIVQNSNVHLERLDWESLQKTFQGRKADGLFRPLANFSFGLNYFFHGLDTWGYHLVNFLIHCLSTLFLYLFIFKTLHLPIFGGKYAGRAGSIALLAAVLWASSPMQVTAVTYIVQRMASMAAMFFILAMLFYLLGRTSQELRRKIAWFALCVLSGILAIASKENAALLPVALYLFDLLLIQGVHRQRLKRHLLLGAVPLLLMLGLAFLLTDPLNMLSGYANRDFSLLERLLTQARILIYYLSLLIYPMPGRFALIHEVQLSTSLLSPWTTLPAVIFWIGWAGLGIFLAKRKPLISFGLLFFLLTHLLESSFIPLELIYEHRNYLPSMALFMLLGVGIMAFLRDFCQKRLLYVLTCLVLLVSIAGQGKTVIDRNSLFEHPLYVWADNVQKAPGLSRVHTNLGKTYSGLGMQEEAMQAYQDSLQADRYHRPDLEAVPLNNLGNHYLRDGNPGKALEMYEQALQVEDGYQPALFGSASALLKLGEPKQAGEVVQKLLEARPGSRKYQSLYSLVLFRQGEYESAIQEAVQALDVESKPSLAHKVLAEAHAQLGEQAQAQKYWQEYAEAHSKDMEAWLALVRQAYVLEDDQALRRAAVRCLALKRDRAWEEVFAALAQGGGVNHLVLADDPRDILPMIKQGVQMELGGWET